MFLFRNNNSAPFRVKFSEQPEDSFRFTLVRHHTSVGHQSPYFEPNIPSHWTWILEGRQVLWESNDWWCYTKKNLHRSWNHYPLVWSRNWIKHGPCGRQGRIRKDERNDHRSWRRKESNREDTNPAWVTAIAGFFLVQGRNVEIFWVKNGPNKRPWWKCTYVSASTSEPSKKGSTWKETYTYSWSNTSIFIFTEKLMQNKKYLSPLEQGEVWKKWEGIEQVDEIG